MNISCNIENETIILKGPVNCIYMYCSLTKTKKYIVHLILFLFFLKLYEEQIN